MNSPKLPEIAKLILERIENQLVRQCSKGEEKYGETIDEASGYDWNQMAMEELVDCVQYLMKENLRLSKSVHMGRYHEIEYYEKKYRHLIDLVVALRNTLDIKNTEVFKNYRESESTLYRSLLAETFDANKQVIHLLTKIINGENKL